MLFNNIEKIVSFIRWRSKRSLVGYSPDFGDYYISKKKKVIFIHIPKTGGKSIRKVLYSKNNGASHLSYTEVSDFYTSLESFFVFTIVRNPVDRFVSAYNYLVSGGNKSRFDMAIKLDLLSKYNSIDDFAINGLHKWVNSNYIHFKPQMYFIQNLTYFDLVIKLEDIKESFSKLPASVRGDYENLPYFNSSKKLDTYLSNKALQVIEYTYKVDYDSLTY